MATMCVDKRTGNFVIQWYTGNDKVRRSISLSSRKFRHQTAERVKKMIETLIYYRHNGQEVPDRKVERWLEDLSPEIIAKLAEAGLINVTKQRTCKELFDTWLKHKKSTVKPKSYALYCRGRDMFFKTFSPTELVESITSDRVLDWKAEMLAEFAEPTVTGYLNTLRMAFTWGVDHDWVRKNPTKSVPMGSYANRAKDRTISMDEYAKLLDACPNQEWRTIIALARVGGLRCPSELQRLKWADINWEQNRFVVRAPKTERYVQHSKRIVPLFPELRKVLDQHFFSLDETDDNEFVIASLRNTSWNLQHMFDKISNRAGLGEVERPFDNMRMSRSNEVLTRWGAVKESLWIGHSTKTMIKHYLCLSDTDFSEAAGVTDSAGADVTEESKSHAKIHAILTE